MKTVQISREQNRMVRQQIESHTAALKNWIASAVEQQDLQRATTLVGELRAYEAMYHIFVPDDMF